MQLDPRTIAVVMITSTLLIGGGLLVVTRGYLGAVAGTRRWAGATLLQSVGWFVTGGLRGLIPDYVSATVGPSLVITALVFYLFVLHDFEERPVNRRWFYLLLASHLVLSGLFAVVMPNTAARQMLIAATAGSVALRSAHVLLSGPNRRVASHRFMAAVFAVCGVVVVVRGVVFVVADPARVLPTAANAMSSVTLMAFYIVAVVLPFGFLLMCNDRYASQRIDAEHALTVAARTDALTQMPNRTMVTSRLVDLSARARDGSGALYAVLFIDLNNFKYVNDSLGHEAGDRLLIETGGRLTDVVRASDTLVRGRASLAGRFGGDEFVLILDGLARPEHAGVVAERILDAMAAPFVVDGQRVSVQCSIGISVSDPTVLVDKDLLREADTAMYRAKLTGRANYVLFDESMHVEARRRFTLESRLRAALDAGQIRAHYQPIVDLTTGSIVAFEALARWHDLERGMIPPDAFIPVAEETGLIVQLGRSMMQQAIATLERMSGIPGGEAIRMNVNVSRRELVHPHFLTNLRDALGSMNVAPNRLRLEITETAVSGSATLPVSELLHQVKDLGVEILLDDFGAGLSSLSLLRALPLDGIKIDRTFLDNSTGDVQAITILNAIISLGRNLGKTVTVEGVTESSQVATVLALGGDLVQGYLFGHPVPAAEAEGLLGTDFSSVCDAA